MRFIITGSFAVLIALPTCLSAQTKTITNDTLAAHREKRLEAERQLRENYAKMGFPSPEEIAKQNETDAKARFELSQQLRNERLERERREAELMLSAQRAQAVNQPQIIIERQDANGYLYGYSVFGGRRHPWRSAVRFPLNSRFGWRSAGGMVIYNSGGNSNTLIGSPINSSGPMFRAPHVTPPRKK